MWKEETPVSRLIDIKLVGKWSLGIIYFYYFIFDYYEGVFDYALIFIYNYLGGV